MATMGRSGGIIQLPGRNYKEEDREMEDGLLGSNDDQDDFERYVHIYVHWSV